VPHGRLRLFRDECPSLFCGVRASSLAGSGGGKPHARRRAGRWNAGALARARRPACGGPASAGLALVSLSHHASNASTAAALSQVATGTTTAVRADDDDRDRNARRRQRAPGASTMTPPQINRCQIVYDMSSLSSLLRSHTRDRRYDIYFVRFFVISTSPWLLIP